MDSYEAFFDQYCAFMKKYAESNNDPALLSDYLKFMSQYTETMQKLDDMKGELSDAELVYYNEVMTRITQKLLDAAK